MLNLSMNTVYKHTTQNQKQDIMKERTPLGLYLFSSLEMFQTYVRKAIKCSWKAQKQLEQKVQHTVFLHIWFDITWMLIIACTTMTSVFSPSGKTRQLQPLNCPVINSFGTIWGRNIHPAYRLNFSCYLQKLSTEGVQYQNILDG